MKTETIHLGEFIYVLPGSTGGRRAEGVEIEITDQLLVNDEMTPYFAVAYHDAKEEVKRVYERLVATGATSIRFVQSDNQPFAEIY